MIIILCYDFRATTPIIYGQLNSFPFSRSIVNPRPAGGGTTPLECGRLRPSRYNYHLNCAHRATARHLTNVMTIDRRFKNFYTLISTVLYDRVRSPLYVRQFTRAPRILSADFMAQLIKLVIQRRFTFDRKKINLL